MMLAFFDSIVGHGKQNKPGFLREQHCMGCRTTLAIELTDKFGSTYAGEWWVVKDAIWLAGELHLLYGQEKWYGNPVTCPRCLRKGNLPIDKPYNWELIEKKKRGEQYAVCS